MPLGKTFSAKPGFKQTSCKKFCYSNWKSLHRRTGRANELTALSPLICKIKDM